MKQKEDILKSCFEEAATYFDVKSMRSFWLGRENRSARSTADLQSSTWLPSRPLLRHHIRVRTRLGVDATNQEIEELLGRLSRGNYHQAATERHGRRASSSLSLAKSDSKLIKHDVASLCMHGFVRGGNEGGKRSK